MNQNNTLETANEHSENSVAASSVDEFIRELEHMEQDLHITSELQIEVSESEFDDKNIPDFVLDEIKTSTPDKNPATDPVSQTTLEKLRREVAQLESAVGKFKAERIEILDRSQRQSKDFENFKNRTERERHERLSIQMENLATSMLPVLDNLDRAMEFARDMSAEQRRGIEPFLDGIALVHHQVSDVLATMGVKPIVAFGEQFDPHFHEAVSIEASETQPPNTVSDELLKGYQMGSRVLRHSIVKVTAPAAGEQIGSSGEFQNELE
jgi:molecular chaperone GrpE